MSINYTLPASTPAPSPLPIDEGKKDVYGYDIWFRKDFQITNGGDYVRIGGEANIKAALYRRMLTRPGEYKFRPDYGVGVQDFVKKAPTTANLDQLRQRIIDNLSLDPRLTSIVVTVEADTIQLVPVLRVFVQAVVSGGLLRFEPYVFTRST